MSTYLDRSKIGTFQTFAFDDLVAILNAFRAAQG